MINKENLYCPSYFKSFRCIGGECEDSCCIGWEIEIDKPTFKQYFKVKDADMKKRFQKNLYNNEECFDPDIDYGRIRLKKDKRCPFLDEKNLCDIYKNCGEGYLSKVCTHFPRVLNKIDDYYEISLDVACPEAARLILGSKDGIEFEKSEENLNKYIVAASIDTKSKNLKNSPMKYFNEIKDLCFKIIRDRRYDLDKRLYILGDYIENLQDSLEENLNNFIDFNKNYNIDEAGRGYEKNNINYVLQSAFSKNIIEELNIENEIDSVLFKEHTRNVMESFYVEEGDEIYNHAEEYINIYIEYCEKYIDKYEYIFENYIVNCMINNLFPFSESEFMFDGYIMLLVRYALMKFYLVGLYKKNKEDSDDKIIKFVQVFSKAMEHDKNYRLEILEFIKENDFDNMEFAKTLL